MEPKAAEVEGIQASVSQKEQAAMPKDDGPVMRAAVDDYTVWQSVRRFKKVGCIAMAAAFCASLDGYRKPKSYWNSPQLESC